MQDSLKILYFSINEWGNMGRRKIRLAYELARRSEVASLLYVNPPVTTSILDLIRGRFLPSHLGPERRRHFDALLGRPRQVNEKVRTLTGTTKTIPLTRFQGLRHSKLLNHLNQRFYVAHIRRCLDGLPGSDLVVWLSCPLYAFALDAFPDRILACYDWTDDWLEFEWPLAERTELAALNDRSLREVDLVFAVSDNLYHRAQAANPRVGRVPNATDWDVIGRAASPAGPVAPELSEIPAPIVGYVGQIGDRVDYDLLFAVAQAHPEWSLVFVGPVWPNEETEVTRLSTLSNVHFVGRQPYSRLPAFLRGFDVCMMPHLRNALTLSMDPIKLYDYLASGKPIVSTEVAGVERFADVIHVGNSASEFVQGVQRALSENGARVHQRLAYARKNTWQARATLVWQEIQRVLSTETK